MLDILDYAYFLGFVPLTNELLIGDIDVSPINFELTMRSLKRLACSLGISEIHFHACKGTTLHVLFSGWGKVLPSFPVIFKDLGGDIPTSRIKFTLADIDIF